MKCPFCGGTDLKVLESRTVEDGEALRRRRECGKCEMRFTTLERVKENLLWVLKKDGKREIFDREKIRKGVTRAVQKRPVSLNQINEIVHSVERELLRREEQEVPSRVIGNAILKRLKKLDKVAWLRFASVYLQFEDLTDFEKLIDKNS